MPSESPLAEPTKRFFGNLFGKKRSPVIKETSTKPSAEERVEELERSLQKDDPLIESNTFNGDKEDERKNSKNKRREEKTSGIITDENKENVSEPDKTKPDKDESKSAIEKPHYKSRFERFKDRLGSFGKKHEDQPKKEVVIEEEETKPLAKDSERSPSPTRDVASSSKEATATDSETTVVPSTEAATHHDDQETLISSDNEATASIDPTEHEVTSPPRAKPRRILDHTTAEDVPPKPARRRRRKTKMSRSRSDVEKIPEEEAQDAAQDAVGEEETLVPPEDDVLAVTVHKSDHLRADLKHISHPVVRVSVVDGSNGTYLPKSSTTRRVTSYYEHDNVTSILPIMTQPYDFRKKQSVLPRWEETIIFNDSFEAMVAKKNIEIPTTPREGEEERPPVDTGILSPSPMLFFVIRDFVSMQKANNQRSGSQDVTERGWHTIAWAFLKLIGADGKPNCGRQLRLQLFYPPRSAVASSASDQLEAAFAWWRHNPRSKYPSTLYVTVQSVRPSSDDPSFRGLFPLEPEGDLRAYKRMKDSLNFADESQSRAITEQPKWTRLPGQACKVPNSVCMKLWTARDGAFSIRFSNSGLLLAVACKHRTGYPVLLYGIPNGEEMGVLIGHQQLIYDIHWSNDDHMIVTSSGDGTAQVWNLRDKSKPTHTLPHPAYVYTAAFHPAAQHVVATGGYDCVVRVWSIASETAEILQELEGHKSFINSLAFDFSHLNLYSVDSAGVIISWSCHTHEQRSKKKKLAWSLKTKFVDKDLTDVSINSVQVHMSNKKLLLHCRDSVIRMFDVRINTSLNFTGSVNRRQFLRSALTPCGSFVISGSEDGNAYVWNAESGDQVAIYNELGYPRAVRDVTFHPHEHMVAFCCFSPNMPVLVFKYERGAIFQGMLSAGNTMYQADDVGRVPGIEVHAARSSVKIDRIMQQLDAVTPEPKSSSWHAAKKMLPVSMAIRGFSEHSSLKGLPPIAPLSRSPTPNDAYISPRRQETLRSTFGTTSTIEPSYLSPHASRESRRLGQQFVAQQSKIDEQQATGWRPSFAAVGGSPYRNDVTGGPDVSFNVDEEGNRTLRITATPDDKNKQYVVALYDYQANRSDELTMMRGDVIKVLYKDGPSWWFGERRSDEKQGYFPVNYVEAQGGETEVDPVPAVLFGTSPERPPSLDSTPKKTVHALKMGTGSLKFYSQSESEGDDETKKASLNISSRQRRRDKRSQPRTDQPKSPSPTPGKEPKPSVVKREPSLVKPKEPETAPRKLPSLPSIEPQEKTREEVATSPEPTPKVRKTKQVLEEKSEAHEMRPLASGTDDDVITHERPRFGVLKAVQAKMAEEQTSLAESSFTDPPSKPRFSYLKAVQEKMAAEKSMFSETIVDGADYSAPPRASALDPIVTSTAVKSRPSRSRASRRMRQHDRKDDVPMITIQPSSPPSGVDNPAYDDITEV